MATEARPFTSPPVAGQVLDDGFARWRRNFRTLSIASLAITLPVVAFEAYYDINNVVFIQNGQLFVDDPVAYNRTQVWLLWIRFGVLFLSMAVCTNVIYQDWRGRRMGVGTAFAETMPRLFGFIGACVLAGIISIIGLFAFGIVATAGWPVALAGMVALFIILAPLAQMPALYWAGAGAARSVGRSFELARGRRLKIAGVVAVSWIIFAIFGFSSNVPGFALLDTENVQLFVLAYAIASFFSAVIGIPLFAAMSISLYHEGVITKEGFDIREMLGALPPIAPRPPPLGIPPPQIPPRFPGAAPAASPTDRFLARPDGPRPPDATAPQAPPPSWSPPPVVESAGSDAPASQAPPPSWSPPPAVDTGTDLDSDDEPPST